MEKQHTGELCESLCRLMDGEAESSEAQFMLRRLGHDEELSQRWERYHLVRSVLRDHRCASLEGFAERVSAGIANEPMPEQDAQQHPVSPAHGEATGTGLRRWLQPAAGAAVAASVAVLAFNAWQPDVVAPGGNTAPQSLLSQGIDDPTADVEGRVGPAASSLAVPAAVGSTTNEQLQKYLIRHTQVSATGHRLPLIYMVSETETADVDLSAEPAEAPPADPQAPAPSEP
ncbi:MAG: sigma-E factor negative regulatory protein [Pseudomonadota bacterium]